jgi:hypothetical protein
MVFNNCHSQADASQIFFTQIFGCYFQKLGNKLNLRPSDPNIAFTRPGTAPAAPHTFEMQARNIPLYSALILIHLSYSITQPQSYSNSES